jgi:hypothetical protein
MQKLLKAKAPDFAVAKIRRAIAKGRRAPPSQPLFG